MNSQSKVSVITGAGSGIGQALAKAAQKRGHRVVALDVDDQGLSQLSGVADCQRLDVRDDEAFESIAAQVYAQYGRVDYLFNNAGVLVDGKSWQRSAKDWRWQLEVNVLGVVNGLRAFIPRLLQQTESSCVINTASIGGLLGGSAYMAPYQASKHAIVALTESLHQEMLQENKGVQVACLCPGDVATGIFNSQRLLPESERYQLHSEAERATHEAIAGMVAQGMTPAALAEYVFSGLDAGKFWLLPDESFKALFQWRANHILNGSSPENLQQMIAEMTADKTDGGSQ